jgi:hypothetical protein
VLGLCALAVVALTLITWRLIPPQKNPDDIAVTLLTDHIGEGVESGADVRLDGVTVGSVSSIEPDGQGRQRISLLLREPQLFGLTDSLRVDYAPGNLFGISELELSQGHGGTALAADSVVDLTGANGHRVFDATISTLLRTTGQFTNDVLTPEFTSVVNSVAHATKAFTPLLQTVVVVVESIAETQWLPSSFLLDQYGNTLAGLPSTVDGALNLLYSAYINPYMSSDEHRATFDANTNMLIYELIPAITGTLGSARSLSGLTDAMSPVLDVVARSISSPRQSGRDLAVLLDRLSGAFHDTPDGPVLNVDVDLRGVPAPAGPLQTRYPVPGSLPGGG